MGGFRIGNKDPKKRGIDVTKRNKVKAAAPKLTRIFGGKKWRVKNV